MYKNLFSESTCVCVHKVNYNNNYFVYIFKNMHGSDPNLLQMHN